MYPLYSDSESTDSTLYQLPDLSSLFTISPLGTTFTTRDFVVGEVRTLIPLPFADVMYVAPIEILLNVENIIKDDNIFFIRITPYI